MGGLEGEVAAGGCGFWCWGAEGEVGAEGVVDAGGGGGAELEVGVGGVVGGGDDAEGHDGGCVERCSVVI